MTVPNWIRLRRITGLGALLMLALLAAAMMAGPTAAHHRVGHDPGPGGGDRGTNEAATFKITVSGDLGGNVTTTKAINGKESSIHNNPPDGEDLELDMGVFLGNNATSSGWDLLQRNQCFAGSGFKFTGSVVQVSADKNDPETGSVSFYFLAKGKDGTTEIWYLLAVTPVTIKPPDGADWPYWLPALNETATVTGGPWEMSHSGGPGKKVACTGEGTGDTLSFVIEITRIS